MAERQVVVDASVAIKWFLDEDGSAHARLLLDGTWSLSVPDLIYAEVGNVLWKRLRRGEIAADEGEAAIEALLEVPWRVHPASALVGAGFAIAEATGCTVYDGLYVAAAVKCDGLLVTADGRLLERLASTALASHLLRLAHVQ